MTTGDVYAAIADPTRRRILGLLENEMSVGAIAARFSVTRPAISQHLGVLKAAGLVRHRKAGRTRYYRTNPEPLREVVDWLSTFDAFWTRKLDALARHLEKGRTP